MRETRRPGEITYYDQLGVSPDATPEAIRDSFRALARLLHPDQQTDPQLKAIAEEQMRKLNPIYSVLSDPERRRHYDEDLEDGFPRPIILNAPPTMDWRRFAGRAVWAFAILVSAGVLIWLSSDNAPLPQTRAHVENVPDAPAPKTASIFEAPDSEITRLREDLKSVSAQRDAAVRELSRLRSGGPERIFDSGSVPPERPAEFTGPTAAMTELPSSLKPAVSPLPAARSDRPASTRRLAGFWFYLKPARGQKNQNASLYPPEYIEAAITEENGFIRGKYRARFQIIDRAIPADVSFAFNGVSSGVSVTCPWMGPGGAKGELTLRLISENSLKIDWTAAELGSQQGLVSGTAILTRRLEN